MIAEAPSSVKSPVCISVVGIVYSVYAAPLRSWYLSYAAKKNSLLPVLGTFHPKEADSSFWCSTGFGAGIVAPAAFLVVAALAWKLHASKIVLRTKSDTCPCGFNPPD